MNLESTVLKASVKCAAMSTYATQKLRHLILLNMFLVLTSFFSIFNAITQYRINRIKSHYSKNIISLW